MYLTQYRTHDRCSINAQATSSHFFHSFFQHLHRNIFEAPLSFARPCTKSFWCIVSCNPSNNPVRRYFYCPFIEDKETETQSHTTTESLTRGKSWYTTASASADFPKHWAEMNYLRTWVGFPWTAEEGGRSLAWLLHSLNIEYLQRGIALKHWRYKNVCHKISALKGSSVQWEQTCLKIITWDKCDNGALANGGCRRMPRRLN